MVPFARNVSLGGLAMPGSGLCNRNVTVPLPRGISGIFVERKAPQILLPMVLRYKHTTEGYWVESVRDLESYMRDRVLREQFSSRRLLGVQKT